MTNPTTTDTNQNASNHEKIKKRKIGEAGHWSDLTNQLLYTIMMQLGVFDYISFRKVCNLWRIFAKSHEATFLASKPPMKLQVIWRTQKKHCIFTDSEGRITKTLLPSFANGDCVGSTCGYLIFFNKTTQEFRLLNPITRKQLRFPNLPHDFEYTSARDLRAILVFSRSLDRLVFLFLEKLSNRIWFSINGREDWNHVSFCSFTFTDIRAFRGMIYTLNYNQDTDSCVLTELRLNAQPQLTLVDTVNSLKHLRIREQELASLGDRIYVIDILFPFENPHQKFLYRFQELDFAEMKWVLREKSTEESSPFLSNFKHGVCTTSTFLESGEQALLVGHGEGEMVELKYLERPKAFTTNMWYNTRECLRVDTVDD